MMKISDFNIRRLWTVLQFASLCALLPLGSIASDMATAEPNKSYVTHSGQVIHCDGLLHTRDPDHATCSRYGTTDTNPTVFIFICVAFVMVMVLFVISSKSGRGFAGPPAARKNRE